jgi:hypothetical protein
VSPTWKNRVAGAWVDSEAVGAVRVSGAWVPFGPDGGPTYEALTWPNPPTETDGDDGGSAYYALGAQFHLLVAKPCYGIQWRVPDNVPNPGANPITAALWEVSTNDQLAIKTITPTPGGFEEFLWTGGPVSLSAAPAEYVVSVYTHHYTFSAPTPGSGWLVESPSLNVRHDASRLTGPRPDPPSTLSGWGSFNTWYYISPLIGL